MVHSHHSSSTCPSPPPSLTSPQDGLTDDKKLNVVISCPCYYGDAERRALIDAAALAGMQVLRVISDGVGAAISYGPYRVDELNKSTSHVAFCSFGHSSATVAVARFSRDGLQLIAECCDPELGAREMDLALMKHFAADFLAKNKGAPDPLENKKSLLKLEEAVQKTKKVLSSNEEGPVGSLGVLGTGLAFGGGVVRFVVCDC